MSGHAQTCLGVPSHRRTYLCVCPCLNMHMPSHRLNYHRRVCPTAVHRTDRYVNLQSHHTQAQKHPHQVSLSTTPVRDIMQEGSSSSSSSKQNTTFAPIQYKRTVACPLALRGFDSKPMTRTQLEWSLLEKSPSHYCLRTLASTQNDVRES